MRHEDDFIEEWKTRRIDNSRPPLRWIANLAGHFASNAMVRMFNREEDGIDSSFGQKVDGFIWDNLWHIYEKYGTTYEMQFDEEDL
jgi:hypothetical protein